MSTPRCPASAARHVVAGIFLVVAAVCGAGRVAAQRVYLYSEPTVCSTPFTPVSGITFHAGARWRLTWNTDPGQFGSAQYSGTPNPARSEDGTKRWSNPAAFVECWIDWYQEGFGRQAYYRWEIDFYAGAVSSCSGGGTAVAPSPEVLAASYDPYDPYSAPSSFTDCADATGDPGSGGSSGSGSGAGCSQEYVYVEVSYDDGATWQVLWEGWATVCDA
jgi:hypothetical protein